MEEEFDNFLERVEEVGSIVKGLCSKNKSDVEKATCKADIYLCDNKEFDEDQVKVKTSRTVINKNATEEEGVQNGTMDQVAFMTLMEKDAKQRAKDRKERKVISDGLMKKGNVAFKGEDYITALDYYSKAINETRDSWLLYSNRAVTYLKLGLYKKALEDCTHITNLNENSLKGWLLKARIHHHLGEDEEIAECVQEAKNRHPERHDYIQEYLKQWEEGEGKI